MTSLDDLFFLDNDELIAELVKACDYANQEFAHQLGDEVMVLMLLRSTAGEVSSGEATDVIAAYRELNRGFA